MIMLSNDDIKEHIILQALIAQEGFLTYCLKALFHQKFVNKLPSGEGGESMTVLHRVPQGGNGY